MNKKNTILIVDDEEAILRAIERMLRPEGYNIRTACGGAAGLDCMRSEPVDVVISDLRMPNMDGYEFLSRVRSGFPGVVRILLSGFGELQTIMQSLCSGIAMCYFTKPWSNDEMKKKIRDILCVKTCLEQNGISASADHVLQILMRNMLPYSHGCPAHGITESGDCTISLCEDPFIVWQIIRIANMIGREGRIGSLSEACACIGKEYVKLIVSTADSSGQTISAAESECAEFVRKHSATVDRMVRVLYNALYNKKLPDRYSFCGLLHDICLLPLVAHRTSWKSEILREETQIPQCGAPGIAASASNEHESLIHNRVGAAILTVFDFPEALVEVCKYHHEPTNPHLRNRDLCMLVHIADRYSLLQAEGGIGELDIDDKVFDLLGLPRNEVDKMLKDFKNIYECDCAYSSGELAAGGDKKAKIPCNISTERGCKCPIRYFS